MSSPASAGAVIAGERYQDLPPTKRRRLIAGAALRSVLIAAVLVVLYYVLPLDRPWTADTAVRLLIGLLAFAGVMVWGVRTIAGSRYPGVRAAEALALVLPAFLLLFASTYFVLERNSAANFTQPLTRTDALYFTVTVFTTVGFGDITAKSETARVVLIVQMLADLAFLGAGVRVLLGAVSRGRERRSETGDDAGQATQSTPQ
jgi:voltage-gated potassium channel